MSRVRVSLSVCEQKQLMYLYYMHILLSAYGTIFKPISHIDIHSFINKTIPSLSFSIIIAMNKLKMSTVFY